MLSTLSTKAGFHPAFSPAADFMDKMSILWFGRLCYTAFIKLCYFTALGESFFPGGFLYS